MNNMSISTNKRNLILSFTFALLFIQCQAQGELKGQSIPKNAKVSISTNKAKYFLGENILLHFKLENTGNNTFKASFGSDYRGAARSLRWKVTAIDEQGDTVADPYPGGFCMGGLGGPSDVTKENPYFHSIPVLRYLRFEKPGTYKIKVHHDFGWKAYTSEEFPDAEVELVLDEPSEKEASKLVEAWVQEKDDLGYSVGEKHNEHAAFSYVRSKIFLPALVEEANKGNVKAIWGIGSIPTVDATASLIDLVRSAIDTIKETACRELCQRLPDPYLKGELGLRNVFNNDRAAARKYLVDRSWDEKFAPDIRKIATDYLKTNDKDWIATGAFLFECVGIPENSKLIADVLALEANRIYELRTDIYPRPRGACMELQRAAKVLIGRGAEITEDPKLAGEAIFYLLKIKADSTFRPDDMDQTCLTLLREGPPYVQEHVLKFYPKPLPSSMHPELRKILSANNIDARIEAVAIISRDSLVELKDAALEILKTAKDDWLFRNAEYAVLKVGSNYERLEVLVSRLDEEEMLFDVLDALKSIFSNTGGGGSNSNQDPAAVAKRIKPLWEQFLIDHKEELMAGKKFKLPNKNITEAMFPDHYYMSLNGGTKNWPKQEWDK
ncbi:MAG: hypothetical protein ACI9J3_004019 [Parvicellaceae bacterium]|jgi:hypothetical protein